MQSFNKAAHELLMALLDSTRLTTTWASNSTCKWLIPSWAASINPSRKAQNSATTLVVFPIFLIKPFTHFPLWSRISPPPPAHPGFPCDAPSEFNLYHPGSGLFQQIGLTVQCLIFCLLLTQKKNSRASWIHIKWSLELAGAFSKTTLFLCLLKHQIAKGNWIFQENPLA